MKVVITDQTFPDIEEEKKALSAVPGVELIDGECSCAEDILRTCRDADAILNRYNYLTKEIIDQLENCKVISTYGIGLDRIDVEAASRRGIYVCNSPDYNLFEVADHIVTMVMALSRQLFAFDRRVRAGEFKTPYGLINPHRPSTQTIGFVGFGRIARQAAEKLRTAFGMKVLAYDPFLTEEQIAREHAVKVSLEELMSGSDYVSVNVSLMPSTRDLIGRAELALMKPTAYLVNCSRGFIVNEEALLDALRDRRIAGAGLDTYSSEPLTAESPFCALDNVILTPHVAWYTVEAIASVQRVAAEQVALVLSGQTPTRCVNLEACRAAHP